MTTYELKRDMLDWFKGGFKFGTPQDSANVKNEIKSIQFPSAAQYELVDLFRKNWSRANAFEHWHKIFSLIKKEQNKKLKRLFVKYAAYNLLLTGWDYQYTIKGIEFIKNHGTQKEKSDTIKVMKMLRSALYDARCWTSYKKLVESIMRDCGYVQKTQNVQNTFAHDKTTIKSYKHSPASKKTIKTLKKRAEKKRKETLGQRFKQAIKKIVKPKTSETKTLKTPVQKPVNESKPTTLKGQFEQAIKEGDKQKAKSILRQILKEPHVKYSHHDFTSLFVKGETQKFDFEVLDDGKIAIGRIYEDRIWAYAILSGIEWFWKAYAAIIELTDDGFNVIAECETPRINVRHATNPDFDLWNKLSNDFLDADPITGILTVGLKRDKEHGGYYETSATIDMQKEIDRYDRAKTQRALMNNQQKTL